MYNVVVEACKESSTLTLVAFDECLNTLVLAINKQFLATVRKGGRID